MKSKIRCLFEKINKFIQSEHFIDDLLPLVTVAVVIFSTVFCMLLSPISASAADVDSTMILKAGTYTFNNVVDVSQNLSQNINIIENSDNTSFNNITVEEISDGIRGIRLKYDRTEVLIYVDTPPEGYEELYPDHWNAALYGKTHSIVEDTNVDDTFGNWYIANTNYNEVNGGTPTQCPTLEEQIADYSGSWVQFINTVRQNNPTLANSYQNNIDLAIQSGANSVTLEQRLSEFNGDWQDFERLMADYNVNLQTMYTSYVNTLETQAFEDGREFGNDEGYKNGYLSGLNKGQSDNALKGFFGNFIGGVIDVVDSIHFYEEFDSNGNLTFYLSPWSIVIVVLMVAIVIIFLKVFRGG